MTTKIGVVGLGIMGGAMARNMLKKGFEVSGYDMQSEAVARMQQAGGTARSNVAGVVLASEVVFTSLPTVSAFESVVSQIVAAGKAGTTIVEVSTLPLSVKTWAHEQLRGVNCTLLDCPVSGTGAQAEKADLVVFGSGEQDAWESALPAVCAMSRKNFYLGKFGNGIIMKFLANHLVAIHNAAAGEAFALARKAGLDLSTVFETLQDSAATSRMYQIRGPLIVQGKYDEPSARIEMFLKDLDIITDFASDLRCPTPLFNVTTQMYYAAHNAGFSQEDSAAVAKVFESLAG